MRGSVALEIAKPPTSVGPRSRRKRSLAQAVGENRSGGASDRRRRLDRSLRVVGFLEYIIIGPFSGFVRSTAAGTTTVIVPAALAQRLVALGARFEAAFTIGTATGSTRRYAVRAEVPFTTAAIALAVATSRGFAPYALTILTVAHRLAAVVARRAVPVCQGDMRAAAVVGLENLRHE